MRVSVRGACLPATGRHLKLCSVCSRLHVIGSAEQSPPRLSGHLPVGGMATDGALPELLDPSAMLNHGYKIIKHLGSGAMGSVHKAKYVGAEARGLLDPDVEVAIKFVPATVLQPREILIQGQLKYRNIITLYDVFPYAPAPHLFRSACRPTKACSLKLHVWFCCIQRCCARCFRGRYSGQHNLR